ncbi:hypothetical protein BBJ28_00023936, partial [Nothophytophthora sp. Chile5]
FEPYTHLVGGTQKAWVNTEVSDDKKYTVAHTKNYTKVLLPRDDSLIGCSVELRVLSAARFHITGEVISRSEPATVAAAAIREQIRTEGDVSSADRARVLARRKAKASAEASCNGDGSCGGHGDGHSHDHHDHHHGEGEGGCCGGKGGSCCSSGGDGKGCGGKCGTKKKKKAVVKDHATRKHKVSPHARTSASRSVSVASKVTAAVTAKWHDVREDKVALAALATLVASTTLIAVRLLTRK